MLSSKRLVASPEGQKWKPPQKISLMLDNRGGKVTAWFHLEVQVWAVVCNLSIKSARASREESRLDTPQPDLGYLESL